ncbi:MAG: M15 family metallopeptidase [Patescibacteria group bacterium]|nr:M15 family metallopeptidase [Patescibacteria group bacterium]
MIQWPQDTTAEKNAFYGDFHSPGWQAVNLVHMIPPFKMYYDRQPLAHGILVHKLIVPALTATFNEIWDKCNHDQDAVDKTGASDFGGCFNIRNIAGSNNWSNHSWACAIDLWPSRNGFNEPNPGFHSTDIVVQAFKRQGARWGGDYKGRKDNMHFEFVSR